MHVSMINVSMINVSMMYVHCTHDSCIHGACTHDAYTHDACIHNVMQVCMMRLKFCERQGDSRSRMYDARTVHLWYWSLILMHSYRYDACIYDAAEILSPTDIRNNEQGDSRSWIMSLSVHIFMLKMSRVPPSVWLKGRKRTPNVFVDVQYSKTNDMKAINNS